MTRPRWPRTTLDRAVRRRASTVPQESALATMCSDSPETGGLYWNRCRETSHSTENRARRRSRWRYSQPWSGQARQGRERALDRRQAKVAAEPPQRSRCQTQLRQLRPARAPYPASLGSVAREHSKSQTCSGTRGYSSNSAEAASASDTQVTPVTLLVKNHN
jgi:hypothetical protein